MDVKLDPVWRQAAVDACSEFSYGDIISHAWIYSHLEIEEPQGKMTSKEHKALAFDLLRKMDAFREDMLVSYRRYLVNVRGLGYKIIEPPHQTDAAMKKLSSEFHRSIAGAMSALLHVNESMLSIEDARDNADAKNRLAWLKTVGAKRIDSSGVASPQIKVGDD